MFGCLFWLVPPMWAACQSAADCTPFPTASPFSCSHITKEEFRRLMSSEMYANLQLFESRLSGRGSRDYGSVLGSMLGSGSHDSEHDHKHK